VKKKKLVAKPGNILDLDCNVMRVFSALAAGLEQAIGFGKDSKENQQGLMK
jgi:hypothetical protein